MKGNENMKKISLVIFTFVIAISLMACQGSNSNQVENSSGSEKKDLEFVIIPKAVQPWFDEVNEAAEEQANNLSDQLGIDIKIDYRAPEEATVEEQNSILESAAATEPDGIAIDTNDPNASESIIQEIRDQGIEVIFFASPPPEDSILSELPFVGNDTYEQGKIAAEKLVELLDGKGKVAVMQGVPTAPSHETRTEASIDVLEEHSGIEVIEGGVSNDDIETAQQQASSVLSSNPDLDGYLMSDAAAPIGISQALEEKDMVGDVTVVGIDSLNDIVEKIDEGVIDPSSATKPRMQGSYIVDALYRNSLGEDLAEMIDTGIDVVDEDNIDEFLDED